MEFIEVTDDFIAFLERKEVVLKLKESHQQRSNQNHESHSTEPGKLFHSQIV